MKRGLALAGWTISTIAVPAAVDYFAVKSGRLTMSRLFAKGAIHPVLGPFVVGAGVGFASGLAYHLAQVIVDEQRLT